MTQPIVKKEQKALLFIKRSKNFHQLVCA